MKIVWWGLTAIIAIVLALFAVSNREVVSLAFWPLPVIVDTPLYLAMLAALVLGFVFGEVAGLLGGHRKRRELRRRGRRIEALERELAATQSRLDDRAPLDARAHLHGQASPSRSALPMRLEA